MKTLITLILVFVSIFSMGSISTKNNFDTLKVNSISKMIKAIRPNLKSKEAYSLAIMLYKTSNKYNLDPKIMIAIIDTESEFEHNKISSTGDLSLAQINTTIWNKELTRLKLPKINNNQLIKDKRYALNKMGMILSILKHRHASKDKNWFARYHSQTKKFKKIYSVKVETRMRKIASIN